MKILMQAPLISILLYSFFLSTPVISMDTEERPSMSQSNKRGKKHWPFCHFKKTEKPHCPSQKCQKNTLQEENDPNSISEEPYERDYIAEHERISSFIERNSPEAASFNLVKRKVFSLPNTVRIMRKLSHCRYIDLSSNAMTALPDEVNEWSSLISLDLTYNEFSILPQQVLTIGTNVSAFETISIYLCKNPIERIPDEFYETMMKQEGNRKTYQGFTIVMDRHQIISFIIPKAMECPEFKSFLVNSNLANITNGFCTFQDQKGKYLNFNENGDAFFARRGEEFLTLLQKRRVSKLVGKNR